MPRRVNLLAQGHGRAAVAIGIETAVRHLITALRGELEIYRAKAVATEALIDKLATYTNGSAEIGDGSRPPAASSWSATAQSR